MSWDKDLKRVERLSSQLQAQKDRNIQINNLLAKCNLLSHKNLSNLAMEAILVDADDSYLVPG